MFAERARSPAALAVLGCSASPPGVVLLLLCLPEFAVKSVEPDAVERAPRPVPLPFEAIAHRVATVGGCRNKEGSYFGAFFIFKKGVREHD